MPLCDSNDGCSLPETLNKCEPNFFYSRMRPKVPLIVPMTKMISLRNFVLGVLLGGVSMLWEVEGADTSGSRDANKTTPDSSRPKANATGRIATQRYCQTCHLLPEPDLLDKKTWRDELLPKMRYFSGMSAPSPNPFQDLDLLRNADL